MEYLRIEEDGSLQMVKGKDPETDTDLQQEVESGTLMVVRFRGNQFEFLEVEEVPIDEDDEESETEFVCSWTAVPE